MSRRRGRFDRVGGTRPTGLGWGLVVVTGFVVWSPPPSAAAEVTAVLVAAALGLVVVGVAVPRSCWCGG